MKLSALVAGTAALAFAVAGCSSAGRQPTGKPSRPQATPADATASASAPPPPSAPSRPASWADATSAASGGGMSALIAAAGKEGTLNLIGVPSGFANYGAIIKTFTSRYGIKVHSIAPADRSPQEIAQIKRYAGTAAAADVLDVEMPAAVAHSRLFAPYRVATWRAIPVSQKAPDGAWAADYGGFMSVGYDPARFGTITSMRQLLGSRFASAVALDGNPAQANAALYGVMMANLALGGGPGDIATGVSFFRRLRSAGNFVPVLATTPLTIEAGSTPVVFNWDYLNTAAVVGRSTRNWKVFIPRGAAVGEFRAQAINASAPHPAAARLWEEFLYSQARRGGQNLWLEGGIRPVEEAAMAASGSIDRAALRALPAVPMPATFLTPAQAAHAAAYLDAHWSAAG
jgi:putative spermidine/putrescine transport system substrate-binding protein